MLTFEDANRLLIYDGLSGDLRWREDRGLARSGCMAGYVNTTTGYRMVRINYRAYGAHRLAWLLVTGDFPSGMLDHVDGNPLNNRWSNLREATSRQNCYNRRPRSDSKSGIKGVSRHGRAWRARIWLHGSYMMLGTFSNSADAHLAYEAAAQRYFGLFARA